MYHILVGGRIIVTSKEPYEANATTKKVTIKDCQVRILNGDSTTTTSARIMTFPEAQITAEWTS
jgi:hypothetical protein